ncbi:MAG: HNH endonuclease [Candidatus Acidiferrales bacterium]
MSALRQQRPRLRLDRQAYDELRKQVLKRDDWRCQNCGSSENLQVHHIQSRGRLGADAKGNLITLCSACHRKIHGQ